MVNKATLSGDRKRAGDPVKTKMRRYAEHCKYGSACLFAHSVLELGASRSGNAYMGAEEQLLKMDEPEYPYVPHSLCARNRQG